MEHDIVLSNKMNQFGISLLPVIRPFRGEFLGGGNVPDRRIKPNIKNFSFRIRQRHFDSPVTVARHRAWLSSIVEPALTLTVYIILPFGMSVQDPFFQK